MARFCQGDARAFDVLFQRYARPIHGYLARMTGDSRTADDLLQETYYRFLRSTTTFASDDHRRHYLFRIATNLARDHRRRPQLHTAASEDPQPEHRTGDHGSRVVAHIDLARAMEQLKPRDRSLLWLAYAQGFSHEEIAQTLGVKAASLKALLFRARRRLASLLRGAARGTSDATRGRS